MMTFSIAPVDISTSERAGSMTAAPYHNKRTPLTLSSSNEVRSFGMLEKVQRQHASSRPVARGEKDEEEKEEEEEGGGEGGLGVIIPMWQPSSNWESRQ
jgi:hypothetical protein